MPRIGKYRPVCDVETNERTLGTWYLNSTGNGGMFLGRSFHCTGTVRDTTEKAQPTLYSLYFAS